MTKGAWDLHACVERLREFTADRDWTCFHRTKELATALSIEASELQEAMLWKADLEVAEATEDSDLSARLREEVADVAIFLLLLADKLDLDLRSAILEKIAANERRYEVREHWGKAEKAPHDA